MTDLTPTQASALAILTDHGPCSCTELGELLWTENRRRNRQAWARPAGKVLRALERLGLAEQRRTRQMYSGGRLAKVHEWWATGKEPSDG